MLRRPKLIKIQFIKTELISFVVTENYVLERNSYICRKIEDLKNVNLFALPNS